MKRLVPKETGADADYDSVTCGRSKPEQLRLRRARCSVLARHNDYINKKQQLNLLASSPYRTNTATRESLLACYSRRKSEVVKIIQSIVDLQGKAGLIYCPICSINEPDSIDHFAPKDLYPEFSVYAPNLVPCCSKCNRKKSNLDVSPVRHVLSSYYDRVIDYQFLFCRIKQSGDIYVPVFYIRRCRGVTSEEIDLVKRHVDKFELIQSYEEKAAARLVVEMESVSSLVQTIGFESTATHVLARADGLAHAYGKNHWESVLLRAVSRMVFQLSKRLLVRAN